MESENPYRPSWIKDSRCIHGWVPYIYVTSILLLMFTALFWYFRDAHQLHESQGSLVFQTPPVSENDSSRNGSGEVHVSIIEFRTPILMVVLSALMVLAFANGVLWLVRSRWNIQKY